MVIYVQYYIFKILALYPIDRLGDLPHVKFARNQNWQMLDFSGECDCQSGFLPSIHPETNEYRCYQELLQGPCPEGQQFVTKAEAQREEHDIQTQTKCVEHGCQKEGQVIFHIGYDNQSPHNYANKLCK